MGWWTTEDNHFVGDEPADLITQLLLDYAEQCLSKPTLPEFLGAVLAALQHKPTVFSEGRKATLKNMTAVMEGADDVISLAHPIAKDTLKLFTDTFAEITQAYKDSELERKPSLAEILENIAFVLAHEPDEYLAIAEDISIVKIYSGEPPSAPAKKSVKKASKPASVKVKVGDIFSIPLPNKEYVFGRVLFDVTQQGFKTKLMPPNSALGFFQGAILVEIYRTRSSAESFDELTAPDILVNGIFIGPDVLKKRVWKIVGFQPVDPMQVEFPEALISSEGHALFNKGEISLPLQLNSDRLREINVYHTYYTPVALIYTVLFYLDLQEFMNPEYIANSNFSHSDLRFSKHRDQIYKMLGEDQNQSYFEMAKKHGHDFSRFYKNLKSSP